MPPGRRPRRWQNEALEAARRGIADYKAVIISAATGCGKGSVIAGICVLSERRQKRSLVIAHREELVEEIAHRIQEVDGRASVGIVMAGRAEYDRATICASVQSLTAPRLAKLGRIDTVHTDEAHHSTAPSYRRVYAAVEKENPDWRHIGWTATPFRAGAEGTTKGLGDIYEGVVYQYGIEDAIAEGDLVPIEGIRVDTSLSLAGVKVGRSGDFDEADLAAVVDCEERNRLVVSKYLEACAGQPALVFAVSIDHARHLAEAFNAQGVRAAAVWGEMPTDERRDLVRLFKTRPDFLPVLCSKDLLFEGFDAPACRAVLKARPTKSRVVFVQMIGRGLRTFGFDAAPLTTAEERTAAISASPKPNCLFLDFVDNACELDLATLSDLSTGSSSEEREKVPLAVGDRVLRQHHDEWGIGTVLELDAGMKNARIQWPVNNVHPEGHRAWHPVLELLRYRPTAPEAEATKIEPRVTGVRAYEIILLRGQSSRKAFGWYGYQEAHVVSGELRDRNRLTAYVCGAKERWELWQIVQMPEKRSAVVELVAVYPSRELALEAGEDLLTRQHAKVHKPAAEWKGEAASDKQRRALQKWGIKRDLSDFSKGEASALLDAVVARAMVRRHQKTQHLKGRAA